VKTRKPSHVLLDAFLRQHELDQVRGSFLRLATEPPLAPTAVFGFQQLVFSPFIRASKEAIQAVKRRSLAPIAFFVLLVGLHRVITGQ
jgi:hypothetical protein